MSRQARWMGFDVAYPDVPLSAISASMAETVISDTRAKSRTDRASRSDE
jgi:hypothetical protein